MKPLVSVALLVASSAAATTFSPSRISYASLAGRNPQDSKILLEALQDVGMISITDIPSFPKKETLASLPECIKAAETASEHTFPDGTRRRTLATHSVAGDMEVMMHNSDDDNVACKTFDEKGLSFRKSVADVTKAFATHLSDLLDATKPVLSSSNGEQDFTFAEVVESGEHLEHFHSYQAPALPVKSVETIEWHTDQGLALVFTPGLINGQPTEGFYVQLKDGSTAMVQFDEQDDLVIMLGDGVNQYVNTALETTSSLRSVPHALRMPATTEPRVWYGLMVLPPADAVHPVHQETFGDLRQSMIDKESLALGCSSTLQARQLEEISCEEDTFFCWHRCFNHTDEVSPEACAEQGLDLACINAERKLWTEDLHDKQFGPGCVDLATAENYTAPTNHTGHTNHTAPTNEENENPANGDVTSASFVKSFSTAIIAVGILLNVVAVFSL